MSYPEIERLRKLHQIDSALVEVAKRAQALGAEKKIQAEIEAFESEAAAAEREFHDAHGRQKDIELTSAQIQDQLDSIQRQLFETGVANAKEADALERKKEGLKQSLTINEELLIDCWETVPKLKSVADERRAIYEKKLAAFDEWKKKAEIFRQDLSKKKHELETKRPAAQIGIPPIMLAKYDAIRKAHGGIGMSRITSESTCQECGTLVPEKSIAGLDDERLIT